MGAFMGPKNLKAGAVQGDEMIDLEEEACRILAETPPSMKNWVPMR
jgi:aldehyde:ferredoxin oxidoreductase